jgi:pimeloyl-ACP methyl ester carboxylesterase
MRRARGFIDLVFDVVEETANLVERTHDAVVERSVRRFAPIEPAKTTAHVVTGIQTAISGSVFESIRAINGITRFAVNGVADVAEAGLDRASGHDDHELATPVRSAAAGTTSWYVDHLQSSLNGFWGDYLSRRKSRLDLGMTLRHHGRHLATTPEAFAAAFPNPTNKLCVFVHGLAATEWLWSLSSEKHYGDPDVTFGTRLRDDLGFTPVYLRYNSGRHVSENGRALATLLTEVLNAYPVPVEEIALVGHSMGGLVARSAAHYGREHAEPWVERLRHVACIGAPNLGAPLEKAVNLLTGTLRNVEAAGAQVPAELLDGRSAGVKDLRYGYTVDEEWAGKDPDAVFADARRNVPLVDGVGYYFLGATITRDPDHPLGRLLGDLLVRLPSASGAAPEPARRIQFSSGAVSPGMNHVRIANHPDVYEALRDLLAA